MVEPPREPTLLNKVLCIVRNCVELKEFGFGSKRLSADLVNYLVNKLTPKISKLSIQNAVCDDDIIKTLVTRFTKLKALQIFSTKLTNFSFNTIIRHLKPSLEELHVSHIEAFNYNSLIGLKSVPNLKFFDFDQVNLSDVRKLRVQMPQLVINGYKSYDSCGKMIRIIDNIFKWKLSEYRICKFGRLN